MSAPAWPDLTPRQFDADAPAQPLTLFPAPDATGTLDLFTTTEED